MTKLETFFKDQSKILSAQSEAASNVEHKVSIGSNREAFIKEFIKKSLPSKFVVGQGEVFDSSNNISKQCDIIIYDELMPVLDYSSTQQFIAEGVFSHIEVKSNLTSEELKKSLEITKSVKLIEKKIDAIMHTGELPKHIFSCVFAYKGMSKEKTKEILDQYYIGESNIEKKIDAVCVLGEYIIIKREDPNTPTGLIGLETKDNTLSIFFIELYRSMYKNWEGEPNLIKYIENTSFNRF